jgi:hypothetical protein
MQTHDIDYRDGAVNLRGYLTFDEKAVAFRRCGRTVEIQKVDAGRLYGPELLWKEVGQRLLGAGGRTRA